MPNMRSTSYDNDSYSNQTYSTGNFSGEPLVEKDEAIFWCSLFVMEAVLIAAGNLLTTLAFFRSRKLRKRRYYLMINLAIADALVGVLAMPLFIVPLGTSLRVWGKISWIPGDVSLFIDMFSGFASIVFLAMIALERLYATLRPFNYRALKSRWYVLLTIIAWMAAGSITSLHLAMIKSPKAFNSSTSVQAAMWIPVLTALLLLISISYAIIWRKVRIVHRSAKQRLVEKESSLSRICLLITAVSLVAWLPFVIVNMVFEFTPGRTFNFHVFYITKILHYANSLLNPILYVLKIPDFRASLPNLCSGKIAATSPNELSVPLSARRRRRREEVIGNRLSFREERETSSQEITQ